MGYDGCMTADDGQVGMVTEMDARALLDDLKPGATYSSVELWARYTRLMEAAQRPWGNRNQLGRALSALGCTRKRTRKMVRGQLDETHGWTIPGDPPRDEEEERIRLTVERLGGDGIYPVETVWNTYQALAREHGWRFSMGEVGLSSRLTRMGYDRPRMYKGRKTRYLFVRKAWQES